MDIESWERDEIPEWGLKLHKSVILADENATRKIGREIGESLESGQTLGLIGELGAGKTTFMQGLVTAFGIDENEVSSPTYSLVNEYQGREKIYHLDLYRLENLEDLESVGYWDYFDYGGIVCVEWINKVPESWQKEGHMVVIIHRESGRELRWFRT